MTTREVPYKGIGPKMLASAVITKTCKLTVPDSCPESVRKVVEGKFYIFISFSLYQ